MVRNSGRHRDILGSDRWRGRWTDRGMHERQVEGGREGNKDRQGDRQIYSKTDRWTNRQINRKTDGDRQNSDRQMLDAIYCTLTHSQHTELSYVLKTPPLIL